MDAQALLRDALVIDSHNDTLVAHIRKGNISLRDPREIVSHADPDGTISFVRGPYHAAQAEADLQIDLPSMKAAGLDVGFFAIDCTLARHNHLTYAMDGLGFLFADLGDSEEAVIVRHTADIATAQRRGVSGMILAIENADCTEKSLNVLQSLYQVGVRSIGLTHNVSSCVCDGNGESRPGVGLTAYGERMIREMNRLGMLVDLAHVSESAFFAALDVSDSPVIFSHGNARALCDHSRNLTDAQLVALAGNGGVIGLSYVPFFVDSEAPTLTRLLDHVDHIVGVAGIETVGMGSDFDGGGTLLGHVGQTVEVVEGLIARGYSEGDIRAILGENTLRVLRATIG